MVQNAAGKLTHFILNQAETVRNLCLDEDIPPNQAVHELRKSFKRLRALLRFYKDSSGGASEILRKDIRNFGRLLSPLRESCINADLFVRELSGKNLIPQSKARIAGKKLRHKNRKLIKIHFQDRPAVISIGDFFTEFKTRLTDAQCKEVAGIHILREISSSYLQGFFLFRELSGNASAVELHSLRKRTKRLYYQLDFIRLLHPDCFQSKCEQLDIINDLLGNDHDYHLFSVELRSLGSGMNPAETLILENRVDQLRELNFAELFPILNEFFARLPEDFNQELKRVF